jgi:single-stranded DNA-binding protein
MKNNMIILVGNIATDPIDGKCTLATHDRFETIDGLVAEGFVWHNLTLPSNYVVTLKKGSKVKVVGSIAHFGYHDKNKEAHLRTEVMVEEIYSINH